jgi:hypothetical protein
VLHSNDAIFKLGLLILYPSVHVMHHLPKPLDFLVLLALLLTEMFLDKQYLMVHLLIGVRTLLALQLMNQMLKLQYDFLLIHNDLHSPFLELLHLGLKLLLLQKQSFNRR